MFTNLYDGVYDELCDERTSIAAFYAPVYLNRLTSVTLFVIRIFVLLVFLCVFLSTVSLTLYIFFYMSHSERESIALKNSNENLCCALRSVRCNK